MMVLSQAKSRVHALNVLRLIILDAPLASEVAPIVGDAIISAILGYDDTTWAVRNSATMVFAAAMLRTIDPDKNASNTDRTSSKAITVTELFRRYPSVSSFLLSVMKAGISESIKSHDISDSNSQAFPILLLLSRVQPVVGSGMIAAERTELFIPMIIECLKSRDHSIRSAAARALANLCSGDQIDCSSALVLLKGRTEVLSNTLTKKSQTNWNEIHGSLLAIECLIRSSDLAKKIFRELKADRTMLAITDWVSSSPRFPPCCIATAIEILVYFSIEIDNVELQAETRMCCQHILSWRGSTKDSVGAAKLGAAAASGQCALLLPSVWNTRAHNSGFQQLLSELSNLLENDSIDARLAATKSFKKEIYHYLDQLLSSDDNDRSPVHFRRQTLVSIARMLLLTLRTEMDRDVSSPSSLLGTHPPTVRRLSRCLLECSQAHKALTGGDTGDFLTGLGEQEGALWNVSLHITERESFTEEEGLESNGETLLSANAAELMAIEIASEIQRSTEKSGDDATFLKRVSTFVKVIARLNDPHSSWRSRYSAALAVEASSLLTSRMENQGADLWRKQLLVEILRMLQDSDSDVRSAAGQVASQMFSSASDFQASLTQLPQLILEATYPKVRNIAPADDEHDFMNTLINTILLNCQGAIASIALLQSEIRHSNDTSDSSSSLLNLSTSRKIFEEEDPNPFEERLLANQLATQTLLQMNVTLSNGPLQGQILDLCSSCLGSIQNNLKTKEIVYDLTRFPSVFPAIHSLIVGSAVILYLGASDASGVRQAAKEVLEITHGNKLPIQPEILRSLAALVDAKEGCNATRTTIRECCFLL
jgi:HEAT repeat protein